MSIGFTIRDATPGDVPVLHGLIRELAIYEKLVDLFVATTERLHDHLFGERRYAEALIVERADGRAVGFALYLHNYSTFLAKPGLYLEDLFILPECRGHGLGEAVLRRLATRAIERDCGRFDWTVLDWNTGAIDFYRRLGADILPEWQLCRVSGEALQKLAGNK